MGNPLRLLQGLGLVVVDQSLIEVKHQCVRLARRRLNVRRLWKVHLVLGILIWIVLVCEACASLDFLIAVQLHVIVLRVDHVVRLHRLVFTLDPDQGTVLDRGDLL